MAIFSGKVGFLSDFDTYNFLASDWSSVDLFRTRVPRFDIGLFVCGLAIVLLLAIGEPSIMS